MEMKLKIAICVSCRIALGKLRRVTNIATALRTYSNVRVSLLADSGSKGVAQSIMANEVGLFDEVENVQATHMADRLNSINPDIVVVDTMRVRNLHTVESQLCLILREVIAAELRKFSLPEVRPWDLVILPHPEGHWTPDPGVISAKKIESVGWIYRRPTSHGKKNMPITEDNTRTILITMGGGSGEDRGNDSRSEITALLHDLRQKLRHRIKVVQISGPRNSKGNSIEGADEILNPGPELHDLFSTADLVISAAGYNSVLELACTDVPVLLFPIPRYSDNQEKRARFWEKSLGLCHRSDEKERSVRWMAQVIDDHTRRPIVNLGPSGAKRAAKLLYELKGGLTAKVPSRQD
jgi:predicted glycosyltransferase